MFNDFLFTIFVLIASLLVAAVKYYHILRKYTIITLNTLSDTMHITISLYILVIICVISYKVYFNPY